MSNMIQCDGRQYQRDSDRCQGTVRAEKAEKWLVLSEKDPPTLHFCSYLCLSQFAHQKADEELRRTH